jgi:hypothetical protein
MFKSRTAQLSLLLSLALSGATVEAKDLIAQKRAATTQLVNFTPTGTLSKDFDTIATPVNGHFTPIDIPCGTKVRGLALSGKAEMQKIHEEGSAVIGGKVRQWKCRFILSEGCTLITANSVPILVKAGSVNVFMDKGANAVVHYDSKNGITRVTNVTDRHLGSVHVIFGQHFQELDPGREMVFVPDTGQKPSMVLTHETVGWRNLEQTKLDGMHVFMFTVNAKDMIARCFIYKQLTESPLPEDHRLASEILKSVAALDIMNKRQLGHFPYMVEKEAYKHTDDRQSSEELAARKDQLLH